MVRQIKVGASHKEVGMTNDEAKDGGANGNAENPSIDPFRQAYSNYTNGLLSAWKLDAAHARVCETSSTRANEIAQQWHTMNMAARLEASASYLRDLEKAWVPEEARTAFAELYKAYVSEIKEAWSKVNPEDVRPDVLAAIGGSLINVASAAMSRPSRDKDS
jgi:hypothetical protein